MKVCCFLPQIIVKTSAQYELQKKQQQQCVPGASKLNIKFHSNVSDRAKVPSFPREFFGIKVRLKRCLLLLYHVRENLIL